MKKNDTQIQLDIFCDIVSHILEVKSPHTAHHIQRVPILAEMIAKAVGKEHPKELFTSDDFYKIDIAAKLHDCGKITTADYLLEKSTKLEFLHNRIHEIRNRFEILRRDAEIKYLKTIINTPTKKQSAQKKFKQTIKKLEKDFAFVAECNIGDTAVTTSSIKQLKKIGKQKFKRYFNRLLGLSWFEKSKLLPSQQTEYERSSYETLLQDRYEDMYKDIPTGEVYNLSINKGTINKEERQKIEQHVSETANILHFLKLPKEYKCVINYAAEHHEKPNGEGYPLGLTDKDLSLPSKIMILADIFEALTSTDRPYKAPKKLSETLHILHAMKNKQQIDAEIYDIFIKKQVFMEYAKKYLAPEQIDKINLKDYL